MAGERARLPAYTATMPTPPARCRALAHRIAAVLGLLLVAACQPVDTPATQQRDEPSAAAEADAAPAPGAPQTSTRMPADLGALLAQLATTATEWQQDPVTAEIATSLTDGTWTGASVLYLAPDADRFLLVTADDRGTGQQRPSLEGLGLQPITAEGVAHVPPLPAGILAPEALVAAAEAALDGCGVRGVAAVVYSTGAPAAWDGMRWTVPPAWTAILTEGADGGGDGAAVDPVTGAALEGGCLDD